MLVCMFLQRQERHLFVTSIYITCIICSCVGAGIIASKRCNNVMIYENEVSDGGQVGIFLHRSSNHSKIFGEYQSDFFIF